ncbi:MAG: TetR/AcrR family transcriptional regulator [Anaerolineales bacterium]|nr:TetR/AcrR family transcriptional regulator [Anaerolineales bacterium]MCB8960300.1 TetR/AcrR family transcriptional regulator [Ardenticatenales bacterium]
MGEKQDERRNEILAAALQAFSENGYDKTSIDDVVRATGLSKGTIYWYFKNKQALFTALMEFVVDGLFADFEQVLSSSQPMPPRAALTAILDGINAVLEMNPKAASMTVDFMLQGLHYPEMQQRYAAFYAEFISGLGGIIQRGIDDGEFREVDPYAAAAAFIGLGDGIMMQALIAPQIALDWDWEVKKVLLTAEQLFLQGLLKDGA